MLCHIDFQPAGRRGSRPFGESVLESARHLGIDLISICGAQGSCGRCRVQILDGEMSPLTPAEERELSPDEVRNSYRLACQAYPQSDVRLFVPAESLSAPQRTQVEGQKVTIVPDPVVHAHTVQVAPPSLDNLRADSDRLMTAIEAQHGAQCTSVDMAVLRSISPRLRAWDWRVQTSLRDGECIALRPPSAPQLGLAVDLGTTKVAGYVVDLDSGRTIASKGTMNPQIAYGEDVITRIQHALRSPEEAGKMQQLAVQAITELVTDTCAQVKAAPEDIVDAVIVGNTAMHHLLLLLPLKQLVMAPYVPAVSSAIEVKARDLGLPLAAGAYVHLLPNIAGYVGADHVAMILGTEVWKAGGIVLALDIGTNTEICLANQGEISSVSCASGPAFEGAHITHGMRAASGAIEHLRLVDDQVEYQTIAGAPPVGLCGSGILDALAQLHLNGVVDLNGRMGEHSRVRGDDARREFVLVSEEERAGGAAITITQHDVRELQLAKGAVRTGIQALLEANLLSDEDVDEVIIAGAFGSYIDVSSAIAIGMLPSLPLERFRQVGNAAGTGARMALISRVQRVQADSIARRVRYIELAAVPNFQDLFAQAMYLGEYRVMHNQT